MEFSIIKNNFYQNGKKVFLNSGEIHYFRIRRDLWRKHLEDAREAGLTTISTYVPWAWHEPAEGVFDFNGASSPERDLESWINLCHSLNLNCIVKPGPFILAEFRGAGLPDWFVEKYGAEVKMRNRKGELVSSDGVNLFNETFLEKVALWYDMVLPLIARNEAKAGGPVIMMQICNEIGVFSWLAHQGDYGNAVKERFILYLRKKFVSVDAINILWGTDYQSFDLIELPPDGRLPYESPQDRGRDYEWHCFWRRYYGDYLRMLTSMARDRGITVPLYHNLPGWIYGNGYEFPLNITMYEDLYGNKSEIFFGVDHIPEFMSYRNLHDDRIINDITLAMQGDKPLFAAEFQCGSREHHVVTNPKELELFYKASVANGLTGWNYYMFSQGRNPERKGYSGSTFYWFNPLTAEGERTSTFPLVKRMSRIIKTSEDLIVNAKRKAEVAVLFYPPYYATELERPTDSRCGLRFNPSSIRRPAYFDGLLKVLQILNIDYDMLDLNSVTIDAMSKYMQIWAFSTDEMNGEAQQKIIDYSRNGGNIIIFPCLPDREMSQKPCSLIAGALAVYPSGVETIDSPLIDIFDFKDIKCANPQVIYSAESLKGAEIIARTLNGNICGFRKALGKGSVTHLGTWIGFDTENHKPVYSAFLELSDAKLRQASSDNDYISVKERFTNDGRAVLFVGNYYNEEYHAKIEYTHPETGETVSFPLSGDKLMMPALYGILTPVCLQLSDDLKVLHSTSDILGYSENGSSLDIRLYGDRDLSGEIVFEGPGTDRIISASIKSLEVKMSSEGKRKIFRYNHQQREEIVLSVRLR